MSIKNRYNLLYFIYTFACVCIGGFIAIILQEKGASNTSIGIVTGVGSASTIFLAPFLTSLISKLKNLSLQNIMTIIYAGMVVMFFMIIYVPLPIVVILALYTIIYALMCSIGPYLQVLATQMMNLGHEINFGLARGLGSASWAIGALILSNFIEIKGISILAIIFLIFVLITFVILNSFPNAKKVSVQTETKNEEQGKEGSLFSIIKKYPVYFTFLTAFSLMLCAATSLGTYLINIVTSLGGTTSLFGVVSFCVAMSELPFMALTPRLMRRFKSTQLMVAGSICYLIRNIVSCIAPNLVILVIGMTFQGLSYGIFTAVITYYVMHNFQHEDQAMGQTMITMMTVGVGGLLGNVLGGVLQDMFGLSGMYVFVVVMTIIGALIGFTGYIMSKKPKFEAEVQH